MAGTWDEKNWFGLADYSDFNMDVCIRAMEHDAMSSSSSSVVGSPLAETDKIDRMEEDSLPMVPQEESVPPTSSECLNASTSLVLPTDKNGDKSSALRLEGQCTLNTIMGDRYSPTAPRYSRGQPTPGDSDNEVVTGRRLGKDDQTQPTIGHPPDQAEFTTKPTRGVNLRLLPLMEVPC